MISIVWLLAVANRLAYFNIKKLSPQPAELLICINNFKLFNLNETIRLCGLKVPRIGFKSHVAAVVSVAGIVNQLLEAIPVAGDSWLSSTRFRRQV